MTSLSSAISSDAPADNAPQYNVMQSVKRRFFAMRNGILSDTLRKAGSPYPIIFGLNVPQLREIAAEFGPDNDLADRLHANATTRCSRLLAPMLNTPVIEAAKAERWLRDSLSAEETDLLCHTLLRRQAFAPALAKALLSEATASHSTPPQATDEASAPGQEFPAVAYGALRLIANLEACGAIPTEEALQLAGPLTGHPSSAVSSLARRLIADLSFE